MVTPSRPPRKWFYAFAPVVFIIISSKKVTADNVSFYLIPIRDTVSKRIGSQG